MSNQAITDDQAITAATETQESQSSSSTENQNSEQLDTIPEKFVGKSALEIIQAYNNLERHSSKVSSERTEERKNREALERRVQEMETNYRASQQVSQHRQEPTAEKDPFSLYEEEFDTNPKEAIKNVVNRTREQLIRENNQRQMASEALESQSYHIKQKQENPEYAKLEPTMQQIAVEYQDLVNPARANSVKALKLLHLAALGAKADEIRSEAASKAKKEQTTINQEKRNAFSEGSGSKGDTGKRFEDLSIEEMEKVLGKAR